MLHTHLLWPSKGNFDFILRSKDSYISFIIKILVSSPSPTPHLPSAEFDGVLFLGILLYDSLKKYSVEVFFPIKNFSIVPPLAIYKIHFLLQDIFMLFWPNGVILILYFLKVVNDHVDAFIVRLIASSHFSVC